jgi:hypothetical protein
MSPAEANADVPRHRQVGRRADFGTDQVLELVENLFGVVRRRAIDDDDFKLVVALIAQRVERLAESVSAVEGADDD